MSLLLRWFSGENTHVVDLLRGASIAGVLKALGAILAFGLSVVLGRVLGAEVAGIYFLALTTAIVAATIGRAGLDSAVIRFVAADASADNWAAVRAVYQKTLAIGLICSSLVAAVLYVSADVLSNRAFSDPTVAAPLRIMAVAIVPLSLSVLVSRALLGLSRVRDSVLVLTILPTGIALAGTWALAPTCGVNGAALAYVIAVLVALAYGWIMWRRAFESRSITLLDQRTMSPTGKLLRTGAPLLIGALLHLMIQMSGTLMLGVWADNTDVSRYAVAWRTATLISFVLLAVNTIAQPKFAELYAQRDLGSLAATAQKATVLMTTFAAPVFLVLLAAPGYVMSIFGSDFAAGATSLQILSVGQFINVVAGSVGVLLVMSGHERDFRNIQIVATFVVLALNIMLIPKYGDVGAALAAASALIVQNALFAYFVWIRLGILMINPRAAIRRSVKDT
jgi:O-antigen/teichoic acid export membrane protein